MNRPPAELHERAEELERRLADTGDFVERRWKEIERREAERKLYGAELELQSERERAEMELAAEFQERMLRLRYDLLRQRLALILTTVGLLFSAALVLIGGFQLVLGSSAAALLAGLGSLGTYSGLLIWEVARSRRPGKR